MPDARTEDLTARARLRVAAMTLFAERGFDATSTRAIATQAGVSHALLRHHFGSKRGLERAVDEDVLDQLGIHLGDETSTDDLLASMGGVTARVFGSDRKTRAYLRRRLLDGGAAGAAVFDRLLTGTRRYLEQLGHRPPDGHDWAPYQVMFLILGPMLLEDVMRDSLDADPFDAALLADRSNANQRLIADALAGDTAE